MIRGRAAANCALAIREAGFSPDLIIGHPGWGETLYLREIFPETPQILHGEFYYGTEGGDVGFDPEFGSLDWDERCRIVSKNATVALAYVAADRIVCPTPYQRGRFPSLFQSRIRVIHEGLDTRTIRRRPDASVVTPSGVQLDGSRPVVTYVSRVLEPLRGFHTFMRALPALLAAAPDAHVVIIGEWERAGYGVPPPPQSTWKQMMLDEVGATLDLERVHFMGATSHGVLLDAMSISSAHVYFTYPFVLSWSLLEAMACNCLVLGSDTAPLQDVIVQGQNGVLLDFFDHQALSRMIIEACRRPEQFAPLRENARKTALRFDRDVVCLPAWRGLIEDTIASAGAR
jgi:glycosyltransferase involved in cell wall biosynthesis